MSGNKAVAYIEPGKVEVQAIDYPKLERAMRLGEGEFVAFAQTVGYPR